MKIGCLGEDGRFLEGAKSNTATLCHETGRSLFLIKHVTPIVPNEYMYLRDIFAPDQKFAAQSSLDTMTSGVHTNIHEVSGHFVSEESFQDLMSRIRAGSEEAVDQMLRICRPQIYRIVRKRLGKELRSQYDSDDFVQSVWHAFFEHRSRIMRFSRQDSLVAFLSQVASNKVVSVCRKRLAAESHKKREPLLQDMKLGRQDFTSEQPSPSEVISRQEDWDQLVEGQTDRQKRMLEMRANGARMSEIAAELGVSTRTVRRVFEKLKKRRR